MYDEADSSVPATPDESYDGLGSTMASPHSETTESAGDSSEASTPLEHPSASPGDGGGGPIGVTQTTADSDLPRRVPSLRSVSDGTRTVGRSTPNPLGAIRTARTPAAAALFGSDAMQKARALHQQRMGLSAGALPGVGGVPFPVVSRTGSSSSGSPGSPVGASPVIVSGGLAPGGIPLPVAAAAAAGGLARPIPQGFPRSAPAVPGLPKPSLSERRQMRLGGGAAFQGGSPNGGSSPGHIGPRLSDLTGPLNGGAADGPGGRRPQLNGASRDSKLDDFRRYIDTEKGWITFEGAATITRTGVNFSNGARFTISLDDITVLEELGKGNYGTVYKVRHRRPAAPRFGPGIKVQKRGPPGSRSSDDPSPTSDGSSPLSPRNEGTSGVVMAMKEIRLELDEAKFTTILKELVILHECVSPYIIDFYGAFFQEGAVYMCIEYMDGGSVDKLYGGGVPEPVLRRITHATVQGLKTLKDKHNIIHRDVKPTNILVNTRGQVKICDFGVSGNLVASIAKTNIGCQSYMAPERISGSGIHQSGSDSDGTYSVQSDIWSLGLTIIECAMGRYPYPPEVSSTIFSQLSVSCRPCFLR